MDSSFGLLEISNSSYRYDPYGQIISHQGTWGGGSVMYNSNASPGYLVLVIYWLYIIQRSSSRAYRSRNDSGANMQHELEIIQWAKANSTSPIW
jgi:hypothetical protein